VNTKPVSSIVEVLTPIWQHVLRSTSIEIEDNFFDLGGDSLTAVELFNEIGRACGHDLPPVMIYQAPTIAALAALLESPAMPRVAPLMLLRSGNQWPPVFITHGLGGSVIDFFQLLKHIDSEHPVYGMQAKGIDGRDQPLDRIEEMAEYSLRALQQLQPRGPYRLIGYSLGGLVTLEMARRLSEQGEQNVLVVMLDSYLHRRYLSLGQQVRLVLRLAKRNASLMMRLPLRQTLSYLLYPSERQLRVPGDSSGKVRYETGTAISPIMKRARESAYLALSRYRPHPYPGKVKFVRAAISTDFPDNPGAVWGKFVAKLDIDTVPGDHLGIMTTHAEDLARVVSHYLREADREG
jgi:acetoacetyl-CoA synthetase